MKHSCPVIVYSPRTYRTQFAPSFCQYSLSDWWWTILVSLGMEELLPHLLFSRNEYYFLCYNSRRRGALVVKSTKKKKKFVLSLINLRGLIILCFGADSPWVKSCVSFSFPSMVAMPSFSQKSLHCVSPLMQIRCVLKISLSFFFLKVKQRIEGLKSNFWF